jgi:hypothetical protein
MAVRIVPELEQPGHFSAYGLGLPDLDLTVDAGKKHNVAAYGIANFASPHLVPTMKVRLLANLICSYPFFNKKQYTCFLTFLHICLK